jgi:hypothetical protein
VVTTFPFLNLKRALVSLSVEAGSLKALIPSGIASIPVSAALLIDYVLLKQKWFLYFKDTAGC